MRPVDTLSIEEVSDAVVESADKILVDATADARALQIDRHRSLSSDAVTLSTYSDVNAAAPGLFSLEDYRKLVSGDRLSIAGGGAGAGLFDELFSDIRSTFMLAVSGDLNTALALNIKSMLECLEELQALSTAVAAEASKITFAATAGLLTPPERADIQRLRDDASTLKSDMDETSSDLRSGSRRRRAGRRRDGTLDESTAEGLESEVAPVGQRRGRILESIDDVDQSAAPDNVSTSATAPQSGGGRGDSDRLSLASESVLSSADRVEGSVLDKISYLAICQAIESMNTTVETRDRAEKALEKLESLAVLAGDVLSPTFLFDLQAGFHEFRAGAIDFLSSELQRQIDFVDQFLNITPFRLPTLISSVQNIGDETVELTLTNSLLAACGLRMDSFCDFQGMMEVARSLDVELALLPPRLPKLGRACFTLLAPEISPAELTDTLQTPDREASLFPVQTLSASGTTLVARFPGRNTSRALTTPVPLRPGTLSALALAGAETVTAAVSGGQLAASGRVTLDPGQPQEEVLRYSSFSPSGPDLVFTLIDKPVVSHGLGSQVLVTGEHRDVFDGVYEQRQEIGGGPGRLVIGGDVSTRESIAYSSSSFDKSTGNYSFTLTGRSGGSEHRLQISGSPAPSRKRLLFRGSDPLTPAARFNVTSGNIVEPVTAGVPADMTSEISPGDRLVLSDDVNETQVVVDIVSATQLELVDPYHNGNVTGVTLSLVTAPSTAGSSSFRARLSQDTIDDLRLTGVGVETLSARARLDVGEGTRTLSRADGVATAPAPTAPTINRQRLTTAAPIFEAGDVGAVVTVTSRSGRRQVQGTVSSVVSQFAVDVDVTTKLTGSSFSQSAVTVTGTGSRFLSEVAPGDVVAFGAVRRTVVSVASDVSMTVSESGTVSSTADAWLVVAGGSSTSVANRKFSFTRSPRETVTVVSAQQLSAPPVGAPATDGVWQFNVSPALSRSHVEQLVTVETTVSIVPGSIGDFQLQPTSTRPRFEPDIVPPGSTVLRGIFQDVAQAGIITPLLQLAGGVVEILGDEIPYTSVTVNGFEIEIQLSQPTPRAYQVGAATFCIPTSSTVEELFLNLTATPAWISPIQDWINSLTEQVDQLFARLCRLLQGRPEDLAVIALAVTAGASAVTVGIFAARTTLSLILSALEPTLANIFPLVARAEALGMGVLAESMRRGDVKKAAQMTADESTPTGEALSRVRAYHKKASLYHQTLAADRLSSQLRGDDNNVRKLAEVRAGFKVAAESDINRRVAAARALSAAARRLT